MINTTCQRCGRPWHSGPLPSGCGKPAYVTVVHSGYGCDTGCCGHEVEWWDDQNARIRGSFSFDHPWDLDAMTEEQRHTWIADQVRDAQDYDLYGEVPIRWESCELLDD